jgi:hypothetical protein
LPTRSRETKRRWTTDFTDSPDQTKDHALINPCYL